VLIAQAGGGSYRVVLVRGVLVVWILGMVVVLGAGKNFLEF